MRVALGSAFHCPVKGLGSIGRGRVVPSGFGGGLDDPVLGEAEVADPAAHVGFGGPALPPGGQGAVRIDAWRGQQLCEESIKIDFACLRILLLLYRLN